MSWISDLSANRFNNTYFRDAHGTGFAVDMSGDLVVRGKIRNDDTNTVDISGDLVVQGQTSTTRVSLSYTNVPSLSGCIGDVIGGTNYGTPPSNATGTIQTYRQITFTKGRYLVEVEFAVTAGATAGQFEFFLTDSPTKNNVFGSSSVQYYGTYETYYKFYNFNFNANTTYYLRALKGSGTAVNVWYIELKGYRIG